MSLLYFHLGFMCLSCLCMIAAIVVARFFKAKKWRITAHKTLNYSAVASVLVGLTFAVIMVATSGGSPESLPHRLAGGSAVLGALAAIFLGRSIFTQRDKNETASRRRLHRWVGRLEAFLMLAAILLGLLFVGLL